jgi:exosortase/archaeosortase family protein
LCSGITSIITLLPLAVFLAYFTERTLPRRLVLVAAAIPLAMLGNLLRVVSTVVAAQSFGADAVTTGPVHEWSGVAVYALACLALLGIGVLMRRMVPPPTKRDPSAA